MLYLNNQYKIHIDIKYFHRNHLLNRTLSTIKYFYIQFKYFPNNHQTSVPIKKIFRMVIYQTFCVVNSKVSNEIGLVDQISHDRIECLVFFTTFYFSKFSDIFRIIFFENISAIEIKAQLNFNLIL